MPPARVPAIIVHTGAWDVPPAERDAHREGARRAASAGWRVLSGGGAPADAVVTAIMSMEDDPTLNAGRGSVLCDEGWAELDAALMTGQALEFGAVAGVRDVENPILLARALLAAPEVFLVGEAASAFGASHGVRRVDPTRLVVQREKDRLEAWRARPGAQGPADTVGAVAVDADGRLAAGTSTGGRPGKPSGRVGDAPVVGCGFYADDAVGAAACTGWGEDVLRFGLARRLVDLAKDHDAQDACWMVIRDLQDRLDGRAGAILLKPDGGVGWGFNTPAMGVAWMAADVTEPVVGGIRP